MAEEQREERTSWWTRNARREVAKRAGKPGDAPLTEEDWDAFIEMGNSGMARALGRVFRKLPSTPRCGVCSAPFEGFGGRILRPFGYRPSAKNPHICATCIESSPPGGFKARIGVLFADLRGFTAQSADRDPRESSDVLERFYGCAEEVLFPEAVIDKLIGDEVMALYVPNIVAAGPNGTAAGVCEAMLSHSRELLTAVGYGSAEGPFVDLGVGCDFGEAYVGNVGERYVRDFTAVGDVVNTASRLQAQAGAGQIVLSERVAAELSEPVGEPVEVELKGKSAPERVFRIAL